LEYAVGYAWGDTNLWLIVRILISIFCYFQGLEKDKLAYEKVPAINEQISLLQSSPISIEDAVLLCQLEGERENLLKGTIHARNSFENQKLQQELQQKAANDGLDRLLQHSEIESLVNGCDLGALMDPSGPLWNLCLIHLCLRR
jgi:hypothetical protein